MYSDSHTSWLNINSHFDFFFCYFYRFVFLYCKSFRIIHFHFSVCVFNFRFFARCLNRSLLYILITCFCNTEVCTLYFGYIIDLCIFIICSREVTFYTICNNISEKFRFWINIRFLLMYLNDFHITT